MITTKLDDITFKISKIPLAGLLSKNITVPAGTGIFDQKTGAILYSSLTDGIKNIQSNEHLITKVEKIYGKITWRFAYYNSVKTVFMIYGLTPMAFIDSKGYQIHYGVEIINTYNNRFKPAVNGCLYYPNDDLWIKTNTNHQYRE